MVNGPPGGREDYPWLRTKECHGPLPIPKAGAIACKQESQAAGANAAKVELDAAKEREAFVTEFLKNAPQEKIDVLMQLIRQLDSQN